MHRAVQFAFLLVLATPACHRNVESKDTADASPPDTAQPDTAPGDTQDTAPAGPAVADLAARVDDSLTSVVWVSWNQLVEAESVHVEYSFDEGIVETTPALPGLVGPHEQIVLGVPYDTPLTWRVVSGADPAVEGPAITTGAIPTTLPDLVLDTAVESAWDPADRFMLTSVSGEDPWSSNRPGFWVVLIDRKGRYVWAVAPDAESWTFFPKASRDGRAILFEESFFWTQFDEGANSMVHRIRLDGTEDRVWATPGLAHSFDDLAEDTIAWFSSGEKGENLVVSEGDAEPRTLWDCPAWLVTSDLDRGDCGANAIFWNEDRNTYTVSLWSHETVLEWDAVSGDVLWYADPNGGHGYTVSPVEATWLWQHEAQLLAPDRLLLSSGVYPLPGGDYGATAAYEYQINHIARSMELVWSYVSEPEFAANFKGSVHRQENGNTLQCYGSAGGVKEITPEGEVVWQIRMEARQDIWAGRASWMGDLYNFVD